MNAPCEAQAKSVNPLKTHVFNVNEKTVSLLSGLQNMQQMAQLVNIP